MASSDLAGTAIRLALDATAQTLVIEQETAKLRESLAANAQLIDDFDASVPRADALRAQLREKEALIAQKRSDLIALQGALIGALRTQPTQAPISPESLKTIPVIMNRVQQYFYHMTEAAIEQQAVGIPITAVLGIADALRKLYDVLVSTGKIQETESEKEQRNATFTASREEVITLLRQIAAQAKAVPTEPKAETPA
jgi:phytoene dehydrogenase-like protein